MQGWITSFAAPETNFDFDSLGKSSSPDASIVLNKVAPGDYSDSVKKFGAKFCFFCSDPYNPKNSVICITCGAIMCIASEIGAAGCIGARTMEVEKTKFECPVCLKRNNKRSVLPYYLVGSALRRTPKIGWPLLLLAVQLKNLDSLVLKLVSLTMESLYASDEEWVRVL